MGWPWLAALGLAALAVVWLGWPEGGSAAKPAGGVGQAETPQAAEALPVVSRAAVAGAAAAASGALPLGAGLSPAQREVLRQQWRERLGRAQAALQAFEQHARYPTDSRPLAEHADQQQPFQPIVEDRPLRLPGGSSAAGVRLRTTQERIFLAGAESSRITLALVDGEGRTLQLRVTRAVLHEVTEPGRTASTTELPLVVADNGQNGDQQAGDGVLTATVRPAAQGFGNFAGTVRLDLHLDHAGQPGFIYFDVVYSPETSALWLPGVQEALENGSLVFKLRADVKLPGRYVVAGRVEDSQGRPVALAQFNAELPAGVQTIRLPVFGRLLHDLKPGFPLRLRDVEAFLLKPDAFPDRVMLPRLPGVLHTSAAYTLAQFSNTAWTDDQRERYVAELGRDVAEARKALEQLGP